MRISFIQNLSRWQHKHFSIVTARVLGPLAVLIALMTTGVHPVAAACVYDLPTSTYTCSGTLADIVIGTTNNDIFKFLDGVMGTLTLVSGGQNLRDQIDFSASTTGITVDLSNQAGSQTIYTGFQIWFQGFTRARIDGSQAGDVITGTSGDDIINGGAGDDVLNGGDGIDSMDGMDGNDVLNGGAATDGLYDSGTGNDILNGQDGNDYVWGGAGDDTLDGGPGLDGFRDASDLDITLDMPLGTITGNGTDTMIGVENITLGNGNDTVIGDGSDSVFSVGNGNNTVYGGAGADVVYGGTGVDIVDLGTGDDGVEGYEGDDIIIGGPGRDDLRGGADNDTRADTNPADCADDIMIDTEIDNCIAAPVEAPAPVSTAPEICVTQGSRIAFEAARNLIVIYSDFANTPNGMIITEIPLASVRAVTDDEKVGNAWVPLVYKDSEFAPGWSVGLYWQENHYGAIVYKEYGKIVVDDTGAVCGWF